MPLSTGATWPDLKSNFTAAAEDMTAKFEWLEGHRLPMTNGQLTASAWDWGNASVTWKNIYADSFTIVPLNMQWSTGSHEGPYSVKAYGKITVEIGGTVTVDASFNVDSVSRIGTGLYDIQLSTPYNTDTSMYRGAMVANAISNNTNLPSPRCRGDIGSGKYEILFLNKGTMVGTPQDTSFCFMITGKEI